MNIEIISAGDFVIEKSVIQDHSPEDPRTWGSLGIVEVFENKQPFWKKAGTLFGQAAEEMIPCLANGDLSWTRDGDPFLGIERYRHGSDVLAVSKTGNFPDRQWDVSPIVGWWSPGEANIDLKEKIKDLREIGNEDEIKRILTDRANSDLSVINQWSNGDVWSINVEVLDKLGSVVEVDEIHGCYGQEYAENEAKTIVEALKNKYEITAINEVSAKDTVRMPRRPKI